MANTKISALTSSTTPLAGTEVLPIVQSSATVKVAVSDLTAGRTVSASKFTPTGSSAAGNGLYLPAANALGLSTNGTNAVYVDAIQNVGIGTPSPSTKLTVGTPNALSAPIAASFSGATPTIATGNGMVAISSTDAAAVDKGGVLAFTANTTSLSGYPMATISGKYQTAGAGVYGGYLQFVISDGAGTPTERMRISSTGIVTMSAYGAGAATFSAAGVISSVSDETWKIKDGVPDDPDSMLKKLAPGYWYYNDEKKETFGADRQLGFYAQNVNAAIGSEAAPQPEVITSKALDGTDIVTTKPWGYYDRSVLAVTVMSLQKALATIESLTARIVALEAKIPA